MIQAKFLNNILCIKLSQDLVSFLKTWVAEVRQRLGDRQESNESRNFFMDIQPVFYPEMESNDFCVEPDVHFLFQSWSSLCLFSST
ncbi:hypothetical protein GJAV_G00247220 [Gymnothorax javanicus]|nr:hypothetical protein GJAV_G00247220 [Gymnothorax javanicus]